MKDKIENIQKRRNVLSKFNYENIVKQQDSPKINNKF